jgi:hypothetical protein
VLNCKGLLLHRIDARSWTQPISRIDGYCQHLQKLIDRADEIPFETRREILEAFGIMGKLAMENGQKVLYLNWVIYEARIPLDRLDLAGNAPYTYRLAEPQDGDAPVFAKCIGAIRC